MTQKGGKPPRSKKRGSAPKAKYSIWSQMGKAKKKRKGPGFKLLEASSWGIKREPLLRRSPNLLRKKKVSGGADTHVFASRIAKNRTDLPRLGKQSQKNKNVERGGCKGERQHAPLEKKKKKIRKDNRGEPGILLWPCAKGKDIKKLRDDEEFTGANSVALKEWLLLGKRDAPGGEILKRNGRTS